MRWPASTTRRLAQCRCGSVSAERTATCRRGPGLDRSALAAEQAAGPGRLQAGLDRADLAGGVGVVGLEVEDLVEVAERFLVAAEHALDAAEVEPCALGADGLEDGALEGLAGLGADRGLVT